MAKTFERSEKKYLLSELQYKRVFARFCEKLNADEYGEQTICNEYFDTDDYGLIRASIEKPAYKEKLRLRSYGVPTADSTVYLELKKKYEGVVFKRRIEGKLVDIQSFIDGKKSPTSQVEKEIRYFLDFYKAKPKIFLAYDRIALVGGEKNDIRVTFDKNIRSRTDNISLVSGSYGDSYFDDGSVIMEIKVNGSMPLWMTDILSKERVNPVSFSKYGTIYKKFIAPNTTLFKKMAQSNILYQEVVNYV